MVQDRHLDKKPADITGIKAFMRWNPDIFVCLLPQYSSILNYIHHYISIILLLLSIAISDTIWIARFSPGDTQIVLRIEKDFRLVVSVYMMVCRFFRNRMPR